MGSRSNLSRLARATRLAWSRRDSWRTTEPNYRRRMEYVDAIRLRHATAMRQIGCEGSKRVVEAVLILSYESERRTLIHENDSVATGTAEDRENFLTGIRNAVSIAARAFVIGSVAVGLAVAYLVTRVTCRHAFPIILLKSIEFLGPIFIKFGQWASTRKDLFPEDICGTLAQLQHAVSPHSWFYTKQLLKSIYGPNWNEIFVRFESKVPIGSGCCAQVYKAWVDSNARVEAVRNPRVPTFVQIVEHLKLGSLLALIDGAAYEEVDKEDAIRRRRLQPVAVKVLHPGIKDQLRRDLCIMRGVCKYATYIVPDFYWLSLTDCIDEFSYTMENQVIHLALAQRATR
ncbi:putative aarF domain-containing protein kinase 2 isoform X1 [Megalopta genalis]|uniref:putative aarF domain-containing protein kinase 2 isoform X1 n=1 Tax=Megalopta genalis TaxID=115081 RepID=UPI003FD1AECC